MFDVKMIPARMTRWFVSYFISITVIHLVFCILAFEMDVFLSFMRFILLISPVVLLVVYILFHQLNNKLRDLIDRAIEGKATDDDEKFMGRFSIRATLYIITGYFLAYVFMAVVAHRKGMILTLAQSVFLVVLGLVVALIMASLFFYTSKILLYYLGNKVNYKPLNLLQKLAIPILAAILMLITLASVGIYRMTYRQVYAMKSSLIETGVNKNVYFIDGYFSTTLGELKAHSLNPDVRSMNQARVLSVLAELEKGRDNSKIEMYFVADEKGNALTDRASNINVGDRDYYRKVMSQGTPVFSDPVTSKSTNKQIIVCAVPVFNGGKISGVMCATILLDTLDALFARDTTAKTARFMMIDKNGMFIYHKNREHIGKNIIRDYPDDGKKFVNIKSIIETKEGNFFSYRFNGSDVFSFKVKIPVVDYYLLYSMDKDDLLEEVNFVVIEIIVSLFVLSIVTYFIIHRLAMKFSNPISNMTRIIVKLAEGDMTIENQDFLADEFGDMIRNFKIFQTRLKEIIQRAMDAAVQLSSSAEELAATSSTLSEGAQSQAASVEQASASIEEISGAVELINNNAGEQAELAKATFSSMEELKKDNETVVGYAKAALDAAQKTTDQANTGQHLMENTITGMNSIDESTKKIADIVRLISDISDQVNLLALNASIEAARAGEHGKGFAVVAEEISKLADETASSAKNITQFVKAGLQEVNKGREYVDATGAALKNIIGFIAQTEELVRKITESAENQAQSSSVVLGDTRKVMEMAESISSSTHEQMLTNQEMAKTVEQINQNTQAAAAASEQIASSAEEISAQAESLRSQMEFFKV